MTKIDTFHRNERRKSYTKKTLVKSSVLALIFSFSVSLLYAQSGTNSPYSRYGFGLLADRSMGFNKGMMGVAQGFRDGQIINVQNPASYSAVDSITALFDLGLSVFNGNYKMDNLQQNAKNTSFDHFAFHFRAAKNLGVAVGILPYSMINYDFSSSSEQTSGSSTITQSTSFVGDGGLRQVFLGAGWKPFKNISAGFNVSYLYGEVSHSSTTTFSEQNINTNVKKYYADIATYNLDMGLQYTYNLSKTDRLTFGATYNLGHNVNNIATRTISNVISQTDYSADTTTVGNAFQLPHSISAGLTYSKSYNLQLGADFEYQGWSKCKFPVSNIDNDSYTSEKGTFNDKYKVAIGGSYLPDPFSSKVMSRLIYKFGAYYSTSYANADFTGKLSSKPYEFGLSAGISIPISNRNNSGGETPTVHVTAQWIHTNIPYVDSSIYASQSTKGQIVERTLTENYLKLCLGVSISERWFRKWRVQ